MKTLQIENFYIDTKGVYHILTDIDEIAELTKQDKRETILSPKGAYTDPHNLPTDTGVYAIQIVETGEIYVGATARTITRKSDRGYGERIEKLGIHNRISEHICGRRTNPTSRIAKAMKKVQRGQLHAKYYVLGLTVDWQTAKEWETWYIEALGAELNGARVSNITSPKPMDDRVVQHIEREDLPQNAEGMPQSRYIFCEDEKRNQIIIKNAENTISNEGRCC